MNNRTLSGKVKKTPSANVSADRYEFLGLSEAEPDLGVPPANSYILSSDTFGNRQWVSPSASSIFIKKVANYTAVSGDLIIADTSNGGFTITMPSNPSVGDFVTIVDGDNWYDNNLTIDADPLTIADANTFLILDIPNVRVDLVYDGGTWEAITSVGSSGYSGYSGSSGYSGFGLSGFSGFSGYSGVSGFSGKEGQFGGASFYYYFDSDTYAGTIDTGYLLLTNTDLSLANTLAINTTDKFGSNIQSFIQTIDDSTSSIKGLVKISEEGNTTNFVIYNITGEHYIHENHYHIPIAYITGETTPFSDNVSVIATFTTTGDKGEAGDSGYSGYSGISGYSGFSGYSGSGISGYSGFGLSGFSGFSGYSGISGYSGLALSNFIRVTSNYTANVGDRIIADTSNGAFTITLPPSPTLGNSIEILDGNDWAANNLVIARNNSTIENNSLDLLVDIGGITVFLIYDSMTWEVVSSVGTSGISGYSGFSGYSGRSGYSGSGISGYSGYSGISGYSGYSGNNGLSGTSGISGYSGYSGRSGYSGSGVSGYSGSGTSGYSGASGISGYSGRSGYSGFNGINGTNGTNGTSGWSGISGYSGRSGYSGTTQNRVTSISSSATISPPISTTDQYNVTALSSAATLAAPTGTPADGQRLIIRIKDNGSARALTWTTTAGAYRAVGVVLPGTTIVGKVMYIGCIYNAQDNFWDVMAFAHQDQLC